MLFNFPHSAEFGRVLPKTKIYEHARPSASVKRHFVDQVAQIVWRYKLATETINIKRTRRVPEIQVFHIQLKNGELKPEVLNAIDRAISFPIYYELYFDDKVKAVAAYKRPSDADKAKWVVSEYFSTDWLPVGSTRHNLPIVPNLDVLYQRLLEPLFPYPERDGERLPQWVARLEQIRAKEREIQKCKDRLRKERQFNRKVEINSELRLLEAELEAMISPAALVE